MIKNSFFQIIRDPIYLVFLTISFLSIGLFPHLALFTFGEETRFLIDCSLATMLFFGILIVVYGADISFSREIRRGNLLFLFSKPVSRVRFLLAKFISLSLVVFLSMSISLMGLFLSLRMLDERVNIFLILNLAYYSIIVISFLLGMAVNYFFEKSFVSYSVSFLLFFLLFVFLGFGFISDDGNFQQFHLSLDYNLLLGSYLIYLMIIILAAVALGVSLYLEAVGVLIIVFSIFMMGLVSDYFFTQVIKVSLYVNYLKMIMPNWQYFWMSDLLSKQVAIPIEYVSVLSLYSFCYIGVIITASLFFFLRKEIV